MSGTALRTRRNISDRLGAALNTPHETPGLWQLEETSDHENGGATRPDDHTVPESLASTAPEQAESDHGAATPRDPNIVGFVPAFILGNVYVCKLPNRYVVRYFHSNSEVLTLIFVSHSMAKQHPQRKSPCTALSCGASRHRLSSSTCYHDYACCPSCFACHTQAPHA